MNENIFNSLNTYQVLYFYLASGGKSREEILKHLKEHGKSSTTAKDHAGKAEDGKIPYISCENGKVQLDMQGISEFLTELASSFQYDITLAPKQHRKKRKPEDEYEPLLVAHSPGYQNLVAQVSSANAVEKKLKDRIKKKDAEIKKLKSMLAAKIDDVVLGEMKSKVLVIGSAKVKPEEKFQRDFFLDDPGRLLDVEELVSRYGGEIDNPYEPVLSSEKKLTTENYLQRIGRILFKGKLLQSRLEEQEKLPVVCEPDFKEDGWVKRDSINRVEMEKNRLQSINEILTMDGVSNQMKLSLYAAWFDGVDPEMVELLHYAGELDINANYVIRLLEKPKEYRNYRTIRGLLKQAKMASEAHIKREAAVELISGEWYVEATYRGKPCEFQMMPVDEMQAFMDLLAKHQTEEAIDTLSQMLTDERTASFADGDADGAIVVVNESDQSKEVDTKQEEKVKQPVQIASPDFLHDKEKESGVNCHPTMDDDEAYDGFAESEEVVHGEK